MAELVAVDFDPFKKSSTPDDFSARYGSVAEKAGKALGVDPKVVLGQWGLETGWGKSVIPGTNNLGNIKDFSGKGTAATDNMTGSRDKYRAYESPDQFVDDYVSLIQRKYPSAVNAKTPEDFAKALKSGGYAEDPGYVAKVTTAAKMTPVKATTKGATLVPVDFDPFAEKSTAAGGAEGSWEPKEGGGAAFGVYPKARRDAKNNTTDAGGAAIKGIASGFADVGNTIINSGTKAGANMWAGIDDPNGLIDARLKRPAAGITNIVSGKAPMSPAEQENAERAQGLQDFNNENKGAIFSGGRLLGNIAATYPVGGALAAPVRAAGAAISPSAPLIGNALTKFGNAVASGGMTVGGAAPTTLGQSTVNALARLGGGAITGGATAGVINPDDAKMGAAFGAGTPAVAMALAPVGRYIGNQLAGRTAARAATYARTAPLRETLQEGVQAGYVVPPSSVNPTLYNTVKESISGKIATAQVASTRNQEVTDRLVRRALGVADDAPLSTEALQAYRAAQAQTGYEPLRQMGIVRADQQFDRDLTNIIRQNTGRGTIPAVVNDEIAALTNAHRSQGFDAGDAIDAMRQLRENAQDAFRTGNTALGRTNRAISDAYEAAIERAIPANQPQLLQAYRDARANMARSFSVENALKEGTGTIDARKLAAELQKNTPLDGDLLTVARFASAFPKATQPPSQVAGPAVHNLKAAGSGLAAAIGAVVGGPAGAAVAATVPWVVPPAVRAQMFSQRAQNALVPQAPGQGVNRLLQFARSPEVQQLLYKAAPVAATQSP